MISEKAFYLYTQVVLISVIASHFGLHYMDSIGAIIIAAFILQMGAKILWDCVKELVDTGCKNKHQTCKDCLDKIQTKKRRRALDNNIRNGYHRDTEPYYFKYKCPFCRGVANIECDRAEYYNNSDDNDYGYDDYESDEEFWRRDVENDEEDRRENH